MLIYFFRINLFTISLVSSTMEAVDWAQRDFGSSGILNLNTLQSTFFLIIDGNVNTRK